MEKAWDHPSMGCEKSHKQEGGHKRGTENSSLCFIDGLMSSKEFGVGATIPEIQRKSCASRRHCERWFRITRSISWTGLISITTDGRKSHGHYFKTARLRRTSSWRNIGVHPSENGRCSITTQNSQIRMWYVFQNISGRSHGNTFEDPVVPLERNLRGHLLAVLLWERQFEKTLEELGWEEVPNWECLVVGRKFKLFLSVCVDDIKQNGRKEAEFSSHAEEIDEICFVDIEEPTSFLEHVYLGCTQRECKPNEKIIGQYNKMFESRISAEATENYQDGTNLEQKLQGGPTTWKDMLENVWNGIANRQTRRQSNYTRFLVLAWTITKSKKKNWKIKVNCQKCVPILY